MARKMKDSGIEWIGEIPEGWEVLAHKYIMHKEKSICEHYSGEDVISLTLNGVVKRDLESPSGKMPTTFDGYQFVNPNDLLLCLFDIDVTPRCVGLVKDYGVTSPAYSRFKIHSGFCNAYYNYLLRFIDDEKVFVHLSKNLRSSLTESDFGAIKTIVPPKAEQQRIANYLDNRTFEIDTLLSKARSSIEEYKKLKQAVITQAVTKGVRGEREMKDSGIEWIGEIPVEWRKTQLRHCATIKSGITLGKNYSKDTVLIERPYLRVANVQGGYVDLNGLATIEVTPDEDLKYRLHSGDVLMTEGGDRDKLGRGCVWHGEIEPCLHQNHVFAVQTNDAVLLPEFLEYLTASDVGRSYFDVTAIKTTNLACTSSSKVLAFTIPLPPIEEQIEIVGFIKKRSLELNKLIMKKELLVQELERYKKSLIYEVVTGKREV
mgnify:CR=1 FL=1